MILSFTVYQPTINTTDDVLKCQKSFHRLRSYSILPQTIIFRHPINYCLVITFYRLLEQNGVHGETEVQCQSSQDYPRLLTISEYDVTVHRGYSIYNALSDATTPVGFLSRNPIAMEGCACSFCTYDRTIRLYFNRSS